MSLARLLAWSLLYVGATFSCALESGRLAAPIVPGLAELPAQAGPLALLDEIAFDVSALGSVPPEAHSYRRVRAAAGREGRLFLAYYERAQRWSGRPHDLEACYAAAGWTERESHRLDEAHRPWSRLFERMSSTGESESVRVVHWLERPGPDEDRLAPAELVRRLAAGGGFRPDVVSVYFEFPAEDELDDDEAGAAAAALSTAIESVWR
jgi:hypothetical protein